MVKEESLLRSSVQDIEKVTNILLALDYYDFLLTKAQSRIVRLYHESNLTFEEIGEELGMSKQNASNVYRKAVVRLGEAEDKLGLLKNEKNDKDIIARLEAIVEGEKCLESREQIKKLLKGLSNY